MESLQDTASYDSRQKNAGFSADIDLSGNIKASSLSLNGGKTNLNADYAAVTEQTGIYAQQSDLNVGGKGKFKGAAFTTASAEDNQTVFSQGIEVSDIQNHSNYDGKAISVGLNIGKAKDTNPQANLNGIGYGTDSDSQSSITKAAVTGRAGQSDVTTATKDSLNKPLANTFEASNVNEELGAQVEITRAFGVEAPKAVGDFAGNKQVELLRQGKFDEADKWAEDGVYRVALHTLVGALATGSIDGAVASGTTAVSVPALDNYLKEQGLDDTARKAVLLGFSASVGASIGGDTASTVNSFNQTDNNYLSHADLAAWAKALKSCEGDQRCIQQKSTGFINRDSINIKKIRNNCVESYNRDRCAANISEYYIKSTDPDYASLNRESLYTLIDQYGGPSVSTLRMNNTKIINEAELAHVGQRVGSGSVAEKIVYGAAGGVGASRGVKSIKGADKGNSTKAASNNNIGKNNPNYNKTRHETISGRQSDHYLNQQASRRVSQVTAPIDFDGHIINGEVKRNGRVVGGHSALDNVRVDRVLRKHPNGVYEAKISVQDPTNSNRYLPKTNNDGKSTMFPASWTRDRIKVEVDAAYRNRVVKGNTWEGITPSGVKVKGFLTPNTTAYPIFP